MSTPGEWKPESDADRIRARDAFAPAMAKGLLMVAERLNEMNEYHKHLTNPIGAMIEAQKAMNETIKELAKKG